VISRGTLRRQMAGSVAGHDVVDDCAEQSVIFAFGTYGNRPKGACIMATDVICNHPFILIWYQESCTDVQ
jgi:hypothetical protein